MLSKAVLCTLLIAIVAAEARILQQVATDKPKPPKVYADINGGVKPLEERVKAAQELLQPKLLLISVEAECKKNKDTECKKLKATKALLAKQAKAKKDAAAAKAKAKAEAAGEKPAEKKEDDKKEVKAPCKQSIFWTYFLGTVCLPEKPYDVRPPPKKPAATTAAAPGTAASAKAESG